MGIVCVFRLSGRMFTLYDLKEALVSASGGYLNGAYMALWDLPVWEMIEAIEIVSKLARA